MSKKLALNDQLEKTIVLWNRTTVRATEHSDCIGHSVVATTIDEAVLRSDIIWTCVSDEQAVIECFDVSLHTDISGKLFVE